MTIQQQSTRLNGKVALVPGSGRGIRAAIAIYLDSQGAKFVVNHANSPDPAQKVVDAIKSQGSDAVALKVDIRDVSQTVKLFDDAVAHFGHLDIAICDSGVVSFGNLKDVTPEEFDRVFSLNARGQFFVAREAYRHLTKGSRIVLTSSNTAKDFSVPCHSLYSVSKGAIDSFVRIFSKDCGDRKIAVNAVAPGGTVMDIFHDVSHHYIPGDEKYTPEARQAMAAHASPLHRNGFPEDVANVVESLVSGTGEWINGKVITLDGCAA